MASMFSLQITLNDLRDIRIVLMEDFINTVTVRTSVIMVIKDLLDTKSLIGLNKDRDNPDFTYGMEFYRHIIGSFTQKVLGLLLVVHQEFLTNRVDTMHLRNLV